MTWTREKPKDPGVYWLKTDSGVTIYGAQQKAEIVEVLYGGGDKPIKSLLSPLSGLHVCGPRELDPTIPVEEVEGIWYGPIDPPVLPKDWAPGWGKPKEDARPTFESILKRYGVWSRDLETELLRYYVEKLR